MKVAQLAGYISENENYHHGEACLNDSIAGRGFIAVGGRQLPLIIPQSNFGSRLGGGDDAAAPRYIYAKLNKQITAILYPPIDYWTLPFNFDEGKRGEPKYFVPIVPTVLLESKELPAHGWKLKLWARDVFKVIENVRRMIRLGDTVSLLPMPPTRYAGAPYEWTGTFKTIRGEPWSFGRYTYNAAKNTINITELPLRVWNEQYINMLKKKARSENEKIISSVAGIVDASDDIKINISIKLKPGAKDILDSMNDSVWADGVEEYFQLRCRMDSHINLMGRNGEVIMYKNYEDVMYNWFAVRKEFYAKRIDRQRALIILNIRRLENIIRYIGECDGYNLARKKKAVMESILTGANYDKLCISKLNNPKFTPTAEFDNVILRGPKANYDYLLGLSDLQKTEEVLDEFKQELTNTQRDLINLNEMAARGRFPGAEIWENELDRLEAKIREGQKTFWKYGDVNKYKF
jgi:DNA topoisomerase-2